MALDRLPHLDDDGLLLSPAGDWGEAKYRLVANYSEMFARAMKKKWGARVYIDLFAGSGRAKMRDSAAIVPTSAVLALGVKYPFDRYVLCEQDPTALDALQQRVRRDSTGHRVSFIDGDCNRNVSRILREIPTRTAGLGVLSFCVVDPFKLGDLKFDTLRGLAELHVDFMVLVPSFMDAHRNLHNYLRERNHTLDGFLGNEEWRPAWRAVAAGGPRQFGAFVVDQFGRSMRSLGYLYDGPGEEVPIRNGKNVLIYHLAFFSRHPLGREFWRKARKSSLDQLGLPLGGA